ncbi:class I SAM-dependent methyltransferase [Nocardia huaxiensis]|uniref:Class I SAM-dependent methyltransferase n=1 Tax=Nocardia huaxiensis TaxID=2755382 RepID=A0A7D6VKR7_9NOCA|nr:class I SAM-dependent methyltransferase [Nocardia huaxiensis]QLY32096.1 class I SAM-dependent methyltransferase [Nocardia huaxiensis]
MNRNRQYTTTKSTEVGELITWPRRYNLLVDVIFFGRANSFVRELAGISGAKAGDHVLDIGCGPGRLARALSRSVGAQGRVVGVDPSEPMIEYSRKHAPANSRFDLGAAQSLSYADASFDVVTSTFAMHHIAEADRSTALAGMFRVLRPGGRLLLVDAHPTGGVHGTVLHVLARVSERFSPHGRGDGHGHGHSDSNGGDPLADVDIRRYAEPLREIGFTGIEFRAGRMATGILTAVKPDPAR